MGDWVSNVDLLTDTLRAEAAGEDLQEDQTTARLIVCAMRQDGTLYELGSISNDLAYADPEGAREMISRIKFAHHRKPETKDGVIG